MNIYQIASQIMQGNNLQLTEAFNGAYKDLPQHIKQALAQSKFAKNFSAHGIDQNSKPVFAKVTSETELNKQLRQLQKVHGQIPAFAIEIIGAKECFRRTKHGPKQFVPGSNNPIFIFAIKNGYEQATLATKGNINKYSEHATNVTHASKSDHDYTTGDKVERSTYWMDDPYDFLELILSKSSGANLYAFVGEGESIAQQRAANMDFEDKYAPTKRSWTAEPGPSKFMQSVQHGGELRKNYRQAKKEKDLAARAASGNAVKINAISSVSDLKALSDACKNRSTSSIQIGDVWVSPIQSSFRDSFDTYSMRIEELLSGEEVQIGLVAYYKSYIDISQSTYDYRSMKIFASLKGDKLVFRTKL